MRKPRGVQIRANRLIGPGKCLVGTIDECPPRGEVVQRPTEAAQEPRGSGPLPSTPARARGSSVRATPSLHPPRILKTISLFYRKEDPEKSRLRGRLQLFFYPSCGDFQLSLREFHLSLITGENDYYGDMHNPWDVTRHTGGSSGGSGAAVAAGGCTIATGSDSGGSVRMPAGLCGIVGLKTTFGRLSRHGLMGLSPTMDHHGPMTRTVGDCALMLQVMAGHDSKDPHSSKVSVPDYTRALTGDIKNLRVGLVKEFFEVPVDPEVKQTVQTALEVLESLGAKVEEVSWPMFHYSHAVSTAILLADVAESLQKLVQQHGPRIGKAVRCRIESGFFVPVAKYIQAQRARALLNKECYDLLQQVDILAGPTLPITAPTIGEEEVQVGDTRMPTVPALVTYTRAHNLTGLPAITVPCGFSASGLPIGLQLAGRAFDEETVLRVAHAYEQATPWHNRRPSI